MNKIPQQIDEVLEVLAKKFGSTGEKLWAVLVKEQVLQAYSGYIYPVLLFILAVFIYKIAPPNDGSGIFLWWFLPIVSACLVFASLSVLQETWVRTQNPEYGALKSISDMFKQNSSE